jgi:capsular exopolysaccharide synthesis family protein
VGSKLSPIAVVHAARKNWLVVIVVAAVISLAVSFYVLGQTKIYQSSATLQFDPQPVRPLGTQVQTVVEMGAGAVWFNREYYVTQHKIIQSRQVATAVVQRLGLNRDRAFLENLPPGSAPAPANAPVESAAKVLQSRLSVDPVKDSRLAVVIYEDANPHRAQKVLTALVDTYIEQNLETALDSTGSAVDWLQGQVGKLKTELESSELDLHSFKMKKNILSVSLDDQSNMLRDEMNKLNDALTAARTRRENVASRYKHLQQIDATDPADLPASELLANSLLQDLRKAYIETTRERDKLLGEGHGPQHPLVKAVDAQREATRSALLAEVRNVQGSVERELAAVATEVTGLGGLLEAAKKQALELNLLEIEYNRLQRAKNNTEKVYSLVLERAKEGDLTRMLRFNNIRAVDRPLVPTKPVRPRVPLTIALGMLIGVAIGIASAVGKEILDRSVKTPDDLENELGVAFLGLLPQLESAHRSGDKKRPLRKRKADRSAQGVPELIVHYEPTSGVAEAARAVRTNILFMSPDKPHKVLLVTSAGPFEGKTMVSCCIAVAMAQAGQRVVLVDCDLRRPRIHKVFGFSRESGVTAALLHPSALDSSLLESPVPGLSVLPSGPLPPNPAELLQSEAFGQLLTELTRRFDRVVLDSPPVVPVTDAAILSTRADGTVLVVRAFETKKDLVKLALRSIRDVGGRLVGTVLNAVDLGRHEYGYRQYYYYKRDGYLEPPEAPQKPEASSAAAPPH